MWKTRFERFRTWLGIVLTLIISVFFLVSFDLPGESIPFRGAELDYQAGVKAALFALASGALFVVSWLPEKRGVGGLLALWLNRVALGGTFFLTGWYWLSSAVDEDPWDHLLFPLFGTLLFCGFIILLLVFLFYVGFLVYVFGSAAIWRFRDRGDDD